MELRDEIFVLCHPCHLSFLRLCDEWRQVKESMQQNEGITQGFDIDSQTVLRIPYDLLGIM